MPWELPEFSGLDDGFGEKNTIVMDNFEEIERVSVKRIPIQYQALPVPVFKAVTPTEYLDSIFDGVDKLIARMYRESTDCPNEKFLIVAYSQGALSAHIALRTLAAGDHDVLNRIAGVAFVADPGRQFNPSEDWWRSADYDGASSISVYTPGVVESLSSGLWSDAKLVTGAASGPLPAAIASKTVSLCHNGDPVCAFLSGATIGPHLSYTATELRGLAALLAIRVPGGSHPFTMTLSIYP
jgi:hypothetical protein